MNAGSVSLLDFLDAPVAVGDPDGRVVYVNPAFESCSGIAAVVAKGRPLAALFEGGGREAALRAVAGVCENGETARFRLRLYEVGYAALVSPIKAHEDSVGVLILLTEEAENDPRLLVLHREIHRLLEEITRCLAELPEATGGMRAARFRMALEDGVRALSEVRKHVEEIQNILDLDD
jgi:PAS domain-containing protein